MAKKRKLWTLLNGPEISQSLKPGRSKKEADEKLYYLSKVINNVVNKTNISNNRAHFKLDIQHQCTLKDFLPKCEVWIFKRIGNNGSMTVDLRTVGLQHPYIQHAVGLEQIRFTYLHNKTPSKYPEGVCRKDKPPNNKIINHIFF